MLDNPHKPLEGKSLLLVDDDEFLRERMSRAMADRGLLVRTAASAAEALAIVGEGPPDLAVFDLKMPGMNGLELLSEVKKLAPATRIVMLTGYGSIASAVEAMHAGAENYVTKPADADQVLEAFHRSGVLTDGEAPPADQTALHTPSLAEAEWNHIQQVLADCGGNITRSAERLGIPRRTLQRKLKKLAP
ncbi:response regulator transcription factor [Botrimarina hoheduenensis]|uniref:Photosynthetic apparatus regulatory protein RegA n=1 Tax=Botrimarina hoheduenensis TaxID=2528000 RepID=A0A5C5W829_9BACT|nr:response regulator [Botrimarina hoheduenensis]TWT46744.1 Photosynthetic apparatus regulatory protein RegA [Botrimarina hoheduenensis]